ncbi:hypothetical protein J4G53_25530 [Serratia ureilytica]|uniref:hypothetical protein n=1 Tax=Serratia ureilytica TaxID=300181 RepID=UPI001AA12EF3|nr:hypothetical protein [Serratia ureilytica]MBO1811590.1 hypothetical protein [Serratia ureilytica]
MIDELFDLISKTIMLWPADIKNFFKRGRLLDMKHEPIQKVFVKNRENELCQNASDE